jgi:hypothetical protein
MISSSTWRYHSASSLSNACTSTADFFTDKLPAWGAMQIQV